MNREAALDGYTYAVEMIRNYFDGSMERKITRADDLENVQATADSYGYESLGDMKEGLLSSTFLTVYAADGVDLSWARSAGDMDGWFIKHGLCREVHVDEDEGCVEVEMTFNPDINIYDAIENDPTHPQHELIKRRPR